MKVEILDGKLAVDLYDVLAGLSTDDKLALAERLGCEDDVIKAVADQIMDGWTEHGSHAADDSNDSDPHYPLGKARRELALRANEVAARQVQTMADTLRRHHAYHKQRDEWAWRMYHRLVDLNRSGVINGYPESPPSAFDAETDAWKVVPAATEVSGMKGE